MVNELEVICLKYIQVLFLDQINWLRYLTYEGILPFNIDYTGLLIES